jgi:hypothetical protein
VVIIYWTVYTRAQHTKCRKLRKAKQKRQPVFYFSENEKTQLARRSAGNQRQAILRRCRGGENHWAPPTEVASKAYYWVAGPRRRASRTDGQAGATAAQRTGLDKKSREFIGGKIKGFVEQGKEHSSR